jgi:hypothetical protein
LARFAIQRSKTSARQLSIDNRTRTTEIDKSLASALSRPPVAGTLNDPPLLNAEWPHSSVKQIGKYPYQFCGFTYRFFVNGQNGRI